MKYLLDTCVIAELIATRPSPKVTEWLDSHDEQECYLSVVTLGEIQKEISKLTDSRKKIQVQAWLADEVMVRFNGRILDVTTEIALHWGGILDSAEKKGRALSVLDALVAATAITKGFTLITRNTPEMGSSGAHLFDPWG